MLGFKDILRALPLTLLFSAAVRAVNPATIKGQDFVDSVTGKRIMIVGVDYQPGAQSGFDPDATSVDVLSNATTCLRDAAILQRLGVNTIRIYNLHPTANHDECASIFNTAGIYMILDVNSPQASINRAEPWTSYYAAYLERIFGMVEAFKDYPNTMAFFGANEVINDVPSAKLNPPYLRAVQRDLRNYIAKHSTRKIPVGYSAADVREVLEDTWAYLQCNLNSTSDMSRSEFFGLNSYSWCGGDATYTTSGFDKLVAMFKNSSIPVFFSEYGCNRVKPRVFNEVQALYGPQMTSLSGGLVYEYSQEEADYGLVTIGGDGSVRLTTDFDNLQRQYNKLNITLLESTTAASLSITPPACSANLISDNGFGKSFTVPPPPPGAQALIDNGISNPNRGKLVTPSTLQVSLPVYGSNGQAITGLAVRAVSNANAPSGQSTSGGNSTSSGSTSSSTPRKNAAGETIAASASSKYILAGMAVAGVMMLL